MIRMARRKGLRPNKNTEDVIENLTKSEKDWIRARRELGGYDIGSVGYKVLLFNDPIRVKIKQLKLAIAIRINHIMNTLSTVSRWKVEIETGEIKTRTENGQVMSKDELETAVHRALTTAESEVFTIGKDLADMLSNVGYPDPALNTVMTITDYELYVSNISKQLSGLGYKLFDMQV